MHSEESVTFVAVFAIAALLIISVASSTLKSTGFAGATCSDSDGGLNYGLFGTVTLGSKVTNDVCRDTKRLREGFCNNNKMSTKDYDCTKEGKTCDSGACRAKIIPPEIPGTCYDGIQNQGETGVDCGGPCAPCTVQSSCNDGVKNGQETDVDCGVGCSPCANGKRCTTNNNCQSNYCNAGTCQNAPTQTSGCTNRVKDGTETDIDCGGSCPACLESKKCVQNADCRSGSCLTPPGYCHSLTQAYCGDSKINGDESDLDCGGSCSTRLCAAGKQCVLNSDCQTNNCVSGTCQTTLPASCSNGVKDSGESDVDCGGSCKKCLDGKSCKSSSTTSASYCASNSCTCDSYHYEIGNVVCNIDTPYTCKPVNTCTNGVKDGFETGVDCGGSCLTPDDVRSSPSAPGNVCPRGSSCLSGSDCATGLCMNGQCAYDATLATQCTNGKQDGAETHVDCGGPTCKRCESWDYAQFQSQCANPSNCAQNFRCQSNNDCTSNYCKSGVCIISNCHNGLREGFESDVDCGGGATRSAMTGAHSPLIACSKCMGGKTCLTSDDCLSGACQNGVCTASQPSSCQNGITDMDEIAVDCGGYNCRNLVASSQFSSGTGNCKQGQVCNSYDIPGWGGALLSSSDCVKGWRCSKTACELTCEQSYESCRTSCYSMSNFNQQLACLTNCDNAVVTCVRNCGGIPINLTPGYNPYRCDSGACPRCITPIPCDNGAKDGSETDVDCGGSCTDIQRSLGVCKIGQQCSAHNDCGGLPFSFCSNGVCVDHCIDGVQNAGESDVDCGGTWTDPVTSSLLLVCPQCNPAQKCTKDAECLWTGTGTGKCMSGRCACAGGVAPVNGQCTSTCTDGIANGQETGVDCGGPCSPCPNDQYCKISSDCQSQTCVSCSLFGNCFGTGICKPAATSTGSCFDLTINQGETDYDCGGSTTCNRCVNTLRCLSNSDCKSGKCTNYVCAGSCTDGLYNGDEEYTDCGGSCPACGSLGQTCQTATGTKQCASGTTCVWATGGYRDDSGVWQTMPTQTCVPLSCTDKVKNGGEIATDCGDPNCKVDCGGAPCVGPAGTVIVGSNGYYVGGIMLCKPGQTCTQNYQCISGVCSGGSCR